MILNLKNKKAHKDIDIIRVRKDINEINKLLQKFKKKEYDAAS